MNWKFWQPAEKRNSYTSFLVNAIAEAAETSARTAGTTSALEAASGLYAAGFAASTHNGPDVLSPSILSEISRRLIRNGECVYVPDIFRGKLSLLAAESWDVTGGVRPDSWRYRVSIPGPSKTLTKTLPAKGVLHFMYSTEPMQPWVGKGPTQWATTSANLAGNLDKKLKQETDASSALVIPVPEDGGSGKDDDPLKDLKADLAKATGQVALVETTQSGFGEGMGNRPVTDWKQNRIGPEPPEVLATLRKQAFEDVMSACLVPSALFDSAANSQGQREAWRRFALGALVPLSRIIGEELTAKLETETIDFDFGSLWAHDLQGRASSVKALVGAGMELAEAKQAAGI